MKKIFVDTNIIIDLIADRKPHSKFAIEIFKKSEDKELTLFTSSHSIATAHYLLKKYIGEKELREILFNLLDFIQVIPVNVDTIKKGLKSKHKDFEDAFQMISANSVEKMDYIITRNIKDFKDAEISVLPPDEFVNSLNRV
ncbi:MAG: twitching motility protein PilT [Bacteroidetes bacterium RIFCSPLOWO2_12_FULL_31_6]|nr:MAG: twitching motility protein PilT [Bacteroidetes bacterium RIFCSPLOWO2_12_FULL_31_6]